jgi:hypothetical protein
MPQMSFDQLKNEKFLHLPGLFLKNFLIKALINFFENAADAGNRTVYIHCGSKVRYLI